MPTLERLQSSAEATLLPSRTSALGG